MERETVTVNIPTDLLGQADQLRSGNESLEEMVAAAIAHEIRRRKALAAHQRIVERSSAIESKTGVQPSSIELIHQIREGQGRRD